MAEKNYDYSNKRSYDGVATKENEALVPFLAHEVLKNGTNASITIRILETVFASVMKELSKITSKPGIFAVERFL